MASTTLDHLIAELLGDVGVLHDEVKALRQVLPGAAEQMAEQIETRSTVVLERLDETIGVLVSSATKLRSDASTLVAATQKAAANAAEAAGNSASRRLQSISETLASELGTAAALEVQRQVAGPVGRAVDDVTSAARGLDTAKIALDHATAKIRVAMWQRAAWTLGAVLLGAGLVLGAARMLGWLDGGMLPEQYSTLLENQRAIYQECRPTGRK